MSLFSLHSHVCDTRSHHTSSLQLAMSAGRGGTQVARPNQVQARRRAISGDTGPTAERERPWKEQRQ